MYLSELPRFSKLRCMAEGISVPIYVESRYRVNRLRIKKAVEDTLAKNNISGPIEISVAIVGNRKMRALNKKYRNIDEPTNVLTFSQLEGEPSIQPVGASSFGDIVISYPFVINEAATFQQLVDDRVAELVEHGVLHLIGEHHR